METNRLDSRDKTTNHLAQYLANDHDRLDGLLKLAVEHGRLKDSSAYNEFRKGLLRHISIEEKIVFPSVKQLQHAIADAEIARLRLDHSAIVALLVPLPSPSIIATLLSILNVHNAREEQTNGVYEIFDQAAATKYESILAQVQRAPEVPVHPMRPLHRVIDATRRAVQRAGYEFIEKEE